MTSGSRSSKAEHSPVYVVYGPELFLKRQSIAQITERVLAGSDKSMALSAFEAASGSVPLADVLDDLRTLPFLAERRLVIVRGADAFITQYRGELEAYLEKPCATGVLLLECRSFPGNTRLAKRVKAVGQAINCEEVKAYKIAGWLTGHARQQHDLAVESAAVSLLADLVGNDLGRLDGELQKLGLYVGERGRVTVRDVEALVSHYREEQVWGILSAIAAGDSKRALTLWEDVWQTDRAASARAIGGLAFKVRQLLNAKRAQEAGAPIHELGRALMIFRDPGRVEAELSAFSTGQVEDMLTLLLEADVAAKTGGTSVRSSIEGLIVAMCRGGRGRRAVG